MLTVFADEHHPRAVVYSDVAVTACECDSRVNHHGAGSPSASAEGAPTRVDRGPCGPCRYPWSLTQDETSCGFQINNTPRSCDGCRRLSQRRASSRHRAILQRMKVLHGSEHRPWLISDVLYTNTMFVIRTPVGP